MASSLSTIHKSHHHYYFYYYSTTTCFAMLVCLTCVCVANHKHTQASGLLQVTKHLVKGTNRTTHTTTTTPHLNCNIIMPGCVMERRQFSSVVPIAICMCVCVCVYTDGHTCSKYKSTRVQIGYIHTHTQTCKYILYTIMHTYAHTHTI